MQQGDIVVRGRIANRAAATVVEPIELVIADQPIRILPGHLLSESLVTGGVSRQVRGARFFCASLRRPLEPPGTPRIRFREEVQPCFGDRDRDGRLDFAILAGARLQAELGLIPITPAPYTVQTDILLRGVEARIVFTGEDLRLVVEIPNVEWNYVGGLSVRDAEGRMRVVTQHRSVRKNSFPHLFDFQSARIEVLSYDRQTRRARLRVLHGFTRADADIAIVFTYGRR